MEASPLSSSSLNWENRSYDDNDLNLALQLVRGSCTYSSYKQHSKYHQEALIMSLFLPDSLIQFGTNWYRMIPLGSNKDSVTPPPTSSVLSPDNVALLLLSSVFMELGQQVVNFNPKTQDSTTTWNTLPTSPPPINLVTAFRPTYIKKDSHFTSTSSNPSTFFPHSELQSGTSQYYSHNPSESVSNTTLRNPISQKNMPETSLELRKPSLSSSAAPGSHITQFESSNPTVSSARQYSSSLYPTKYPPSSGQLPLTPMTSNKISAPHSNLPSMLTARNNETTQRTPPPSASEIDPLGNMRKVTRKLSLNPQSTPGTSMASRSLATQRRPSQFHPHSEMFRPYPLERPNIHRDATPSGLAVSIPPLSQSYHQTPVGYPEPNKENEFVLSTQVPVSMSSHAAFAPEPSSTFSGPIVSEDPPASLAPSNLDVSKRPVRKQPSAPTPLRFSGMDLPWYTIELRQFPLGISGNLVDENEKGFWDPIVEPIASSLRPYFIATVLKIFRAQRKPGKPIDLRLGLGIGDGAGIIEDVKDDDDEIKKGTDHNGNREINDPKINTGVEIIADSSAITKPETSGSKRTPGTIAHGLMELMAEYCTQNFAALDRDAKALLNQALWCLGAYQLSLGPGALKRFRSMYPGPTTLQLKRTHLKHCFYYARLFAHMWGGQVPISRLSNFDISPISVIKVLSASACHQVRRALDELDARY